MPRTVAMVAINTTLEDQFESLAEMFDPQIEANQDEQPQETPEEEEYLPEEEDLYDDVHDDYDDPVVHVRKTSSGQPSLNLPALIAQGFEHYELPALIDSGTTSNMINSAVVKLHELHVEPLDKPINVLNVDNSHNIGGSITNKCRITLNLGDNDANFHQEILDCYVVPLGTEGLILGTEWLTKHNPEIDWQQHTVKYSKSEVRAY